MSNHKLSPKEKSIIALEGIRGNKTLNEIASIYQIDPKLASKYKRVLEKNAFNIFTSKPKKEELEKNKLIEESEHPRQSRWLDEQDRLKGGIFICSKLIYKFYY